MIAINTRTGMQSGGGQMPWQDRDHVILFAASWHQDVTGKPKGLRPTSQDAQSGSGSKTWVKSDETRQMWWINQSIKWMTVTWARICKRIFYRYSTFSFDKSRFYPSSTWLLSLELVRTDDSDLQTKLADRWAGKGKVASHYATPDTNPTSVHTYSLTMLRACKSVYSDFKTVERYSIGRCCYCGPEVTFNKHMLPSNVVFPDGLDRT